MQAVADQLVASKRLLQNMDLSMLDMQRQVRLDDCVLSKSWPTCVVSLKQASEAFINDPIMKAQLDLTVLEVSARRRELAEVVQNLQSKIPPNVGFDRDGRVFLLHK